MYLTGEASEVVAGLVDGLPVGEYSFRAIVIGLVLALFSGKIVTKRQLDDAREDLKLARQINENQAATLAQIDSTLRSLVEFARTTDHVLREIQGKPHVGQPEKEAIS